MRKAGAAATESTGHSDGVEQHPNLTHSDATYEHGDQQSNSHANETGTRPDGETPSRPSETAGNSSLESTDWRRQELRVRLRDEVALDDERVAASRTVIEENNAKLEAAVAKHGAVVRAGAQRLAGAQRRVAEAEERVATTQERVATTQTQVLSLQQRIRPTNESAVTEHRSAMAEWRSALAEHEYAVAQRRSAMTEHRSAIAAHDAARAATQERVAASAATVEKAGAAVHVAEAAHREASETAVQERYTALRADAEARIAEAGEHAARVRDATEERLRVARRGLTSNRAAWKDSSEAYNRAVADFEARVQGGLDDSISAAQQRFAEERDGLQAGKQAYAEELAGSEPRMEHADWLRHDIQERTERLRAAMIEREALLQAAPGDHRAALEAAKSEHEELASGRERLGNKVIQWARQRFGGNSEIGGKVPIDERFRADVATRVRSLRDVLTSRESTARDELNLEDLKAGLQRHQTAYAAARDELKTAGLEVIRDRTTLLGSAGLEDKAAFDAGLVNRREAFDTIVEKQQAAARDVLAAVSVYDEELLSGSRAGDPVMVPPSAEELRFAMRYGSPEERLAHLSAFVRAAHPEGHSPRDTQMLGFLLRTANLGTGQGKELLMGMRLMADAAEHGVAYGTTSSDNLVSSMVDLVEAFTRSPLGDLEIPVGRVTDDGMPGAGVVVGTKEDFVFAGLRHADALLDRIGEAGAPPHEVAQLRQWLNDDPRPSLDDMKARLDPIAERYGLEERFEPWRPGPYTGDEFDAAMFDGQEGVLSPGAAQDEQPERVAQLEQVMHRVIAAEKLHGLTPELMGRPARSRGLWRAEMTDDALERLNRTPGDPVTAAGAEPYKNAALAYWAMERNSDWITSHDPGNPDAPGRVGLLAARTNDKLQLDRTQGTTEISETRLKDVGQFLDILAGVPVRANHPEDSLYMRFDQMVGTSYLHSESGVSGTLALHEVQDQLYDQHGIGPVPQIEDYYAPKIADLPDQNFESRETKLEAMASSIVRDLIAPDGPGVDNPGKIELIVENGAVVGAQQRGRPQWVVMTDNRDIRGDDVRTVRGDDGRVVQETTLTAWNDKHPSERGLVDWIDKITDERVRGAAAEAGLPVAPEIRLQYTARDASWYDRHGNGVEAERLANQQTKEWGAPGSLHIGHKADGRGASPEPTQESVHLGGTAVKSSGGPALGERVHIQIRGRAQRGGDGPDRENGGFPGTFERFLSEEDYYGPVTGHGVVEQVIRYRTAVAEHRSAAADDEASPSAETGTRLTEAATEVREAERVLREHTAPALQRAVEKHLLSSGPPQHYRANAAPAATAGASISKPSPAPMISASSPTTAGHPGSPGAAPVSEGQLWREGGASTTVYKLIAAGGGEARALFTGARDDFSVQVEQVQSQPDSLSITLAVDLVRGESGRVTLELSRENWDTAARYTDVELGLDPVRVAAALAELHATAVAPWLADSHTTFNGNPFDLTFLSQGKSVQSTLTEKPSDAPPETPVATDSPGTPPTPETPTDPETPTVLETPTAPETPTEFSTASEFNDGSVVAGEPSRPSVVLSRRHEHVPVSDDLQSAIALMQEAQERHDDVVAAQLRADAVVLAMDEIGAVFRGDPLGVWSKVVTEVGGERVPARVVTVSPAGSVDPIIDEPMRRALAGIGVWVEDHEVGIEPDGRIVVTERRAPNITPIVPAEAEVWWAVRDELARQLGVGDRMPDLAASISAIEELSRLDHEIGELDTKLTDPTWVREPGSVDGLRQRRIAAARRRIHVLSDWGTLPATLWGEPEQRGPDRSARIAALSAVVAHPFTAPDAADRFLMPDEVSRAWFDAKAPFVDFSTVDSVVDAFYQPRYRDSVSGFYLGEVDDFKGHEVLRAQQHAEETGKTAFYVSAKIVNLSGINAAVGNRNEVANLHYRGISDGFEAQLEQSDEPFDPMRADGTHLGAVIFADSATMAALARAIEDESAEYARTHEYAPGHSLADIPHPDHPDDPAYRGIGLCVGYSEITPGKSLDEIFSKASEGEKERELRRAESHVAGEPGRASGPDGAGPGAAQAADSRDGARSGRTTSGSEGEAGSRTGAARHSGLSGRRGYPSPDEVGLEKFRAQVPAADLSSLETIAAAFHTPPLLDKVTGSYEGRVSTFKADQVWWAQKWADRQWALGLTVHAFYLSMDVANLGGMNLYLGKELGDRHYQGMSDISKKVIGDGDAKELPMRVGGDEFSSIIFVDENDMALFKTAIDRKVAEYREQHGLSDINHPKHPGDPAYRGVGLHLGYAEILPGLALEDIFNEADLGVDRSKNRMRSGDGDHAPTPAVESPAASGPEAAAERHHAGPAAGPDRHSPAEPEPTPREQFGDSVGGTTADQQLRMAFAELDAEHELAAAHKLAVAHKLDREYELSAAHELTPERLAQLLTDPELSRGQRNRLADALLEAVRTGQHADSSVVQMARNRLARALGIDSVSGYRVRHSGYERFYEPTGLNGRKLRAALNTLVRRSQASSVIEPLTELARAVLHGDPAPRLFRGPPIPAAVREQIGENGRRTDDPEAAAARRVEEYRRALEQKRQDELAGEQRAVDAAARVRAAAEQQLREALAAAHEREQTAQRSGDADAPERASYDWERQDGYTDPLAATAAAYNDAAAAEMVATQQLRGLAERNALRSMNAVPLIGEPRIGIIAGPLHRVAVAVWDDSAGDDSAGVDSGAPHEILERAIELHPEIGDAVGPDRADVIVLRITTGQDGRITVRREDPPGESSSADTAGQPSPDAAGAAAAHLRELKAERQDLANTRENLLNVRNQMAAALDIPSDDNWAALRPENFGDALQEVRESSGVQDVQELEPIVRLISIANQVETVQRRISSLDQRLAALRNEPSLHSEQRWLLELWHGLETKQQAAVTVRDQLAKSLGVHNLSGTEFEQQVLELFERAQERTIEIPASLDNPGFLVHRATSPAEVAGYRLELRKMMAAVEECNRIGTELEGIETRLHELALDGVGVGIPLSPKVAHEVLRLGAERAALFEDPYHFARRVMMGDLVSRLNGFGIAVQLDAVRDPRTMDETLWQHMLDITQLPSTDPHRASLIGWLSGLWDAAADTARVDNAIGRIDDEVARVTGQWTELLESEGATMKTDRVALIDDARPRIIVLGPRADLDQPFADHDAALAHAIEANHDVAQAMMGDPVIERRQLIGGLWELRTELLDSPLVVREAMPSRAGIPPVTLVRWFDGAPSTALSWWRAGVDHGHPVNPSRPDWHTDSDREANLPKPYEEGVPDWWGGTSRFVNTLVLPFDHIPAGKIAESMLDFNLLSVENNYFTDNIPEDELFGQQFGGAYNNTQANIRVLMRVLLVPGVQAWIQRHPKIGDWLDERPWLKKLPPFATMWSQVKWHQTGQFDAQPAFPHRDLGENSRDPIRAELPESMRRRLERMRERLPDFRRDQQAAAARTVVDQIHRDLVGALSEIDPMGDVPEQLSRIERFIDGAARKFGDAFLRNDPAAIRDTIADLRELLLDKQSGGRVAPELIDRIVADLTPQMRNDYLGGDEIADQWRLLSWTDRQYEQFRADPQLAGKILAGLAQHRRNEQVLAARDLVARIRKELIDEVPFAELTHPDGPQRIAGRIDGLIESLADPEGHRLVKEILDPELGQRMRRVSDAFRTTDRAEICGIILRAREEFVTLQDKGRITDEMARRIADGLAEHMREDFMTPVDTWTPLDLTRDQIQQVIEHLMVDEHWVHDHHDPDGRLIRRRMDQLADVAEAINRLTDIEPVGEKVIPRLRRPLPQDVLLLHDALAESMFARAHEGTRTWYDANAAAAVAGFHWDRVRPPMTEWRRDVPYRSEIAELFEGLRAQERLERAAAVLDEAAGALRVDSLEPLNALAENRLREWFDALRAQQTDPAGQVRVDALEVAVGEHTEVGTRLAHANRGAEVSSMLHTGHDELEYFLPADRARAKLPAAEENLERAAQALGRAARATGVDPLDVLIGHHVSDQYFETLRIRVDGLERATREYTAAASYLSHLQHTTADLDSGREAAKTTSDELSANTSQPTANRTSRYTPSKAERDMQNRWLGPPNSSYHDSHFDLSKKRHYIGSGNGQRNIYKPNALVDNRGITSPNEPGQLAKREVATFRIDQELGFGRVPPTALIDGPLGPGSIQQWVDTKAALGAEDAHDLDIGNYLPRQKEQMAVLDYVTGNTGRTVQARLYESGGLVSFGHSSTFPEDPDSAPLTSNYIKEHLNKPLSEQVMQSVRAARPDNVRSALQDLGLSDKAIDGSLARLEEVRVNGKITGEAWPGEIRRGTRLPLPLEPDI